MIKRILFVTVLAAMSALAISAQDMPAPAPVAIESVPFARVNYEGVQFTFDAALAASVAVADYAATNDGDGPVASPAYTEFTFEGYGNGDYVNYAPMPRVDVFAIEDFGPYPAFIEQLDELNRLLADRPDLNAYVNADITNPEPVWLPFLPVLPAAQVFRVQPEYIDVDGIQGIRYLVYYSQAMNPITEGEVFYTFQGITDDGQHFVSIIFPISTGTLSGEIPNIDDYVAFAEQYEQYLTETVQGIAPLDANSFSPTLGMLDAVAQSVKVSR
ncbi:hypothetical protein G4Y79_09575 [Phototrophicus methaneseepsis]|uniref:Uncharacterized protein n=1 Tax=Phototrophicus methaneseepsis TaxID=2710758 RepID=A0A7S8ECT1_9CHLR|nr:hypothetical protein [Phototrophicus methaneseepsis]QPC84605.1 hypothetical protein G4Y79_09575 [Phototrophicus methaneseepsis]